jgi:hypothetical protein
LDTDKTVGLVVGTVAATPLQVSGVVTNVEAVHEGARCPGDTAGTPDVSARDKAVSPFYCSLAEFCEQELLPFAFRRRRRRTGPVHNADRPGRCPDAPRPRSGGSDGDELAARAYSLIA